MTLPNAISFLRLLLVPVFAWLHLHDRPLAALIVFVVAAVSDAVDGLLARLLDQRSALGAVLDPLADKLLGLTALLLLGLSGELPVWFLVVALLRDVVVFGVGLTTRLIHRSVPAAPTRISKYATFLLLTTVILALFTRSPRFGELVVPYLFAVGAVAAECLVVATLQYANLWRIILRREQAGQEVFRG